jgi:hypothetical protein
MDACGKLGEHLKIPWLSSSKCDVSSFSHTAKYDIVSGIHPIISPYYPSMPTI